MGRKSFPKKNNQGGENKERGGHQKSWKKLTSPPPIIRDPRVLKLFRPSYVDLTKKYFTRAQRGPWILAICTAVNQKCLNGVFPEIKVPMDGFL